MIELKIRLISIYLKQFHKPGGQPDYRKFNPLT